VIIPPLVFPAARIPLKNLCILVKEIMVDKNATVQQQYSFTKHSHVKKMLILTYSIQAPWHNLLSFYLRAPSYFYSSLMELFSIDKA